MQGNMIRGLDAHARVLITFKVCEFLLSLWPSVLDATLCGSSLVFIRYTCHILFGEGRRDRHYAVW